MSFSKRLKQILEEKNISQAEAARRSGIAQQSMNYILNNNLSSSKLAAQIADALKINSEWLIHGIGRSEITRIYEIPIIHSVYMLKKYLENRLPINTLEYVTLDTFLGEKAFAYLIQPNKMAICTFSSEKHISKDFITLRENEIAITKHKTAVSFPIFEWRERNGDF